MTGKDFRSKQDHQAKGIAIIIAEREAGDDAAGYGIHAAEHHNDVGLMAMTLTISRPSFT